MELLKLRRMPKLVQRAVICPSCGSFNFRSGREDFYCSDCSLVMVQD